MYSPYAHEASAFRFNIYFFFSLFFVQLYAKIKPVTQRAFAFTSLVKFNFAVLFLFSFYFFLLIKKNLYFSFFIEGLRLLIPLRRHWLSRNDSKFLKNKNEYSKLDYDRKPSGLSLATKKKYAQVLFSFYFDSSSEIRKAPLDV